jgi:hypothetical protein
MENAEDYSQYAGDVKGQAGLTVGQMFGNQGPQETEEDISLKLTGQRYAHTWGDLAPRRQEYLEARKKYGMEQRKAAEAGASADFRINDAKFYAGIGDFGAVESLMKSKGSGLFQIGESIDLEETDEKGVRKPFSFIMAPKGSYAVPDDTGKIQNVSAFGLAKRMGVRSLPFKGGDMKAQDFRSLVGKVQRFQMMANQLRQIYTNNIYLGTLDPSEASANAKALESNIKMDYLAIMKDMKGMGGNVSDNDMAIAESMVPQRASNMFTRLGGNELSLLDNAREGVLMKLKDVAGNNGIDLIDGRQESKRGQMLRMTQPTR